MMSSKVWAPGKKRPCLARKSRTSGLVAADALADELVEVADHLAVGGQVLRASSSGWHRPCPARTGRASAGPSRSTRSPNRSRASASRKSYSRRSRIRSPTSSGSASSRSRRLRGDVAEHVGELRVGGLAGRRARSSSAFDRTRAPGRRCPGARAGCRRTRRRAGIARAAPRVAGRAGPSGPAARPGPGGSGRRAPAALDQAAQGLGDIALGHDVVGEGVEDLVGVEVGDLLASVPARSAPAGEAAASSSAAPRRRRAGSGGTRPPRSPRVRACSRPSATHRW